MNNQTSLLSLLTIPSLLLFTPNINIASTTPKTEVVDPQTNQLAQAPDYQVYKNSILQEISGALVVEKEFKQALRVLERKETDIQAEMLRRVIALKAAEEEEFDVALEAANSIEDATTRNSTLLEMAFFLAEAQKTERALQVLQSLPENKRKELRVLQSVVRSLAAQGKVDSALEIAQSSANNQDKAVLLAEAGAVEEALEIAATLEEEQQAETLAFITKALARIGKLDQAVELAQSLPKDSWQGFAFSNIVKSLIAVEQWEQALEVAQLIEDNYSQEDTDTKFPSGNHLQAFYEIAVALRETGKLEQALQVTEFIDDEFKGFKAPVLGSIAVEFAKLGKFDQALEIARGTENDYDDSQIGIELAKAGKLKEARQIAQSLQDNYYQIDVLSEVVTQLTNLGKLTEAIEIAQSLENEENQGLILGKIALTLGREGKVERALQLTQQAPASEKTEITGKVAEGLIVNDFAGALEIFRSLEDNPRKYWIARNMAVALTVNGQVDKALQFSESLELPHYNADIASLLEQIAVNFARLGDFERALEISQSIHEYFRWGALGKIAIELAAVGDVEQSLSLAESSFANSFDSYQDDLLAAIARELAEKGQVEKALALTKNGKYTSSQTEILGGIAIGLGAKGEFSSGVEIAESLEDDSVKANALGQIALQLIEAKKFRQGMEVAQLLNNSVNELEDKVYDLNNIAIAFAQAKEIDSAFQVLEMFDFPKDDQQKPHFASGLYYSTLREIATSQVKVGNVDEALEITESLYPGDKILVLNEVTRTLVKSGETNRALELAKSLENGNQAALVSIALALGQEGQVDEGLELARSLDKSQQVWGVLEIAIVLVEQGKIEQAVKLVQSLPEPPSGAVTRFAIKLAEVGEMAQAMEIAQSITDFNKDLVLAHVAAAFAERGELDRAKEVRQSIAGKQIYALEIAISESITKGQLATAEQLSQLLPNNPGKVRMLNKLASNYIKAGEEAKATEVLNQAFAIVKDN